MYYVYVLKSLENKDLYIGISDNLRKRFKDHNKGKVWLTKGYRPWELIYYEAYKSKRDITRREKQLKEHIAKDNLKLQLSYSLK